MYENHLRRQPAFETSPIHYLQWKSVSRWRQQSAGKISTQQGVFHHSVRCIRETWQTCCTIDWLWAGESEDVAIVRTSREMIYTRCLLCAHISINIKKPIKGVKIRGSFTPAEAIIKSSAPHIYCVSLFVPFTTWLSSISQIFTFVPVLALEYISSDKHVHSM